MSARPRAHASLACLALLLTVALSGRQTVSAAPAWWDSEWKVRRRIDLKGARRSAYAPLVAYVQFRGFGHMTTDASDVRVVNDQGKPIPARVVFYHPRLYCVVAFEPENTTWRGYVYYGNPKAPKPDNRWRPQSGLLLTTYRRNGDGCNDWQQMQETVRRSAAEPDGAGFRPAIFDGHNPFGASTEFVSVYDGYFYAPRTGTYSFATISDNASFVFIDGQLVTQWPGRHGVQGGLYGEHKGSVTLQSGAHRVQYYHLQFTGTTVAELAWWLPGEREPKLLEAKDYLNAYGAEVDLQEILDEPARLEFAATPLQTLEHGDHHYILWRFGDLSGAPGSPATASQWDFGNGLTSNERSPFVWFFRPGDYEVTLRTTLGSGNVRTIRQWIRVADLIQLDGAEKPDAFDRAARMVASYPIGPLREEDRRAVLSLLTRCEKYDAIEKACRTWLDDVYRKNERVPVEVVLALGSVLTDVRARYADAETAYEQAAGRLRPDDALAYQIHLALGELRVAHLKKYDSAIAALEKASQSVKDKSPIDRRRIAIALGDAYRAKRQRDAARQQYQQAEQLQDPSRADAPMRSSYGLTVEAFLDRGDTADALDKLREWADRFPTDKIGGYWSLLMGRSLIQLDRLEEAADELALAAQIDPFGNYTRDILEQLGHAYDLLDRPNEAVEALRSAANLLDDPSRRKFLEQKITEVERKERRRRR